MKWCNNKYGARKTYSKLCDRMFDSKAEARRGEELVLLQKAGEISKLEYQVPFLLCRKPNIKIRADFAYHQGGRTVYEDVKGMGETREYRVKRAWLEQSQGITIALVK